MNKYFKVGDIVRNPYTNGLYRVVEIDGYYIHVVTLCACPHRYMYGVRFGLQLVKQNGKGV